MELNGTKRGEKLRVSRFAAQSTGNGNGCSHAQTPDSLVADSTINRKLNVCRYFPNS